MAVKMMELSKEQRLIIQSEMEVQAEMLSVQEIEVIASYLNMNVNIPFLSEKKEQTFFFKIVRKFDRMLYVYLPNELYGLVNDSSDGISEKDAENLKELLSVRLTQRLDIPFVPEMIEKVIFDYLVVYMVNAMRKGFNVLSEP